jgi:cellulose synthase/poly-beta-1,6-N-acetylglucosamine synthase-like glycosyltransferase
MAILFANFAKNNRNKVIIVFFISVFLLFHSYILYPIILWLLACNRKPKYERYSIADDLPFLSIIMSVHNEESVIEKKIESIFDTTYPIDKIEVIVGSDHSTDKTNSLLSSIANSNSKVIFIDYSQRQGKVGVMNQLIDLTKGDIIVSTDANVFLDKSTLFNLVSCFKDDRVGLVDTHMINTGVRKEGISFQESAYISREVSIKNREGILWGTMIGPFGGCYAIRKEFYQKPPLNTLVDDFYINMRVLELGKHCINSNEAVVYEDVSNELSEEFRRKVRISMGNFQNLKRFKSLLWPLTKPVSFAFLSHKVLRWLGPLFIIFALVANLFLAFQNQFFLTILVAQVVLFSLPLIDFILKQINIHILLLRFATHFFSMNLALLVGLIKYFKGVNSNVWQPTQRNQ